MNSVARMIPLHRATRKMYIILIYIYIFICLLPALCIADNDVQAIPSEANATEEKLKDNEKFVTAGSKLSIRVGTFGDEVISRQIYDEIKKHLAAAGETTGEAMRLPPLSTVAKASFMAAMPALG